MISLWIIVVAIAQSQGLPVDGVGQVDEGSIRFSPEDVHFYLWTRENPDEFQSILPNATADSYFSNSRLTKLIAHGWNQDGLAPFVIDMKNAFLLQGDYNIISIDWGVDASSFDYYSSAYAVDDVGAYAATLVDNLISLGANIKDFHVIGFSLGAHVAGNVGSHVSGSLARITGLDPAHPSFDLEDTDRRLDMYDADFVDIIHTNSGTLLQGALSFPNPIGHVDFFPNGGHEQPGCFDEGKSISDLIAGCSHGRAPEYFTESINSSAFVGYLCASYEAFEAGYCNDTAAATMGYGVSLLSRGSHYLKTGATPPYALGF